MTLNLQFLMEKLIARFFKLSFNIKLINKLVLFKNKKTFSSIFKSRRKYNKKKRKKIHILEPCLKLHKKPLLTYSKNRQLNILKIDRILRTKYNDDKEKKQEEFAVGKKKKLLGQFFPFLLIYQKYLNAQLLAEQISRLIKKKKKHYQIFNSIYNLLKIFELNNHIISYRISINGKINSKSRAQKLYIVKGHIPNQSFLKRINFGLAQAKTPTGTFGIRVWVYF